MSKPNSILQERVTQAAKVMKVETDTVWALLATIGIEQDDDDALELMEADTTSENDVDTVKGGGTDIPRARFKAGWAILRGKGKTTKSDDTAAAIIKTLRSVKQYSDEELLGVYTPDCSSDICEELERRSHRRNFLVFNDEELDVPMSLKMLRIARRSETTSQHVIQVEGKTKTIRLYHVGEFPQMWVEISPLHPDTVLVDGYCHKCENTWDGISLDDRVIVRVAADMGAIDATRSGVCDIHKMITEIRKNGAGFLLEVPTVATRYEELKDNGRLPVLRQRATTRSRNGVQDPLFVKHRQF